MSTQLAKRKESLPTFFSDFFLAPFDSWFNDEFPSRLRLPSRLGSTPLVNISERKDDYLVTMAAPGLKKEDFKIEIEGNSLTISSEREEDKEQSGERFTRREYSYSSFCRSFTLPDEVMKDKIDAKYENGVLNIILPKKEEAKKATLSKMIEVK